MNCESLYLPPPRSLLITLDNLLIKSKNVMVYQPKGSSGRVINIHRVSFYEKYTK
jgi:hypothetical protein